MLDVVLAHQLDRKPGGVLVGLAAHLDKPGQLGGVVVALLDHRVGQRFEHVARRVVAFVGGDEALALLDALGQLRGLGRRLSVFLNLAPILQAHRGRIVERGRGCIGVRFFDGGRGRVRSGPGSRRGGVGARRHRGAGCHQGREQQEERWIQHLRHGGRSCRSRASGRKVPAFACRAHSRPPTGADLFVSASTARKRPRSGGFGAFCGGGHGPNGRWPGCGRDRKTCCYRPHSQHAVS